MLVKDIARFHENQVELTDGKRIDIDLVVMATGYKANVSFLYPDICEYKDQVNLYLKVYDIYNI